MPSERLQIVQPAVLLLVAAACKSASNVATTTEFIVQDDTWRRGDPIPGWDDYDCGIDQNAIIAELEVDDVGVLMDANSADKEIPYQISVEFSEGGGRAENTSESSASGRGHGPYDAKRGQGWWLPWILSGEDLREAYGVLDTTFGVFYGAWGEEYASADIWICVQRLRPDEFTGFVRWDIPGTAGWYQQEWRPEWEPFQIVIPFDVWLPDAETAAKGCDYENQAWTTISYAFYDNNDGVAHDYATAWPWDQVTDPDIRQIVYDRYDPGEEGALSCNTSAR